MINGHLVRKISHWKELVQGYITTSELEIARVHMSFNKALGLDQLSDKLYKKQDFWDLIKERLLQCFNKWCDEGKVPSYINAARIVSLSKEDET